MNVADLKTAKESADSLAAKIDALLEAGPKILLVQERGRLVNVRANNPLVQVEILDLDDPESEDPQTATTRRYPFDIY